jgi:hypothetical protein
MIRYLLFSILMLCLSLPVQAEYFIIRQYHVEVTFHKDGHAVFEETIQVEFTQQRHGIFRSIPLRSIIENKKVDRILRDERVEGFKMTTSKENHNLILKIGDPKVYVDGRQTYRIHYRVLNPLNHFKTHAEFYWDLLGISWPVITEEFTFRLVFPEDIILSYDDVLCYTGAAGATEEDVRFHVTDHEVVGRTTRLFRPGEAMTVAVRLPADALPQMGGWAYFFARHKLLLAPVLFFIAGFAAMFSARNKRETIMTEYFPPEGLSPAVAGGFVDHSVDQNDVLCLIPHLANHGYLRLEAEEKRGLLRKRPEITFFKLKNAGGDLMPFEKEFLDGLFATGDMVKLESLKDKFYTKLAAVQASVKRWIKDQGWYESDQKTLGCLTGLGGLGALAWGCYAVFAQQNLDGIALIVTGVVLFIFAGKFNKRTPAGNETYRKLEGFRQFVAKAERPVIERLMKDDPLYYDKTMPFALAFGYLRQWNKHFEGLLSQPPSWYHGPHMYGADSTRSWTAFSESFPSEINNIGSVFSSAPSSSGSGGSGGGSSGGGSGGGGGGSW